MKSARPGPNLAVEHKPPMYLIRWYEGNKYQYGTFDTPEDVDAFRVAKLRMHPKLVLDTFVYRTTSRTDITLVHEAELL